MSYVPGPVRQRLDKILGSPSAVRILRVMSLSGVEMSAGEITRRARVNRSGGGRVLSRLRRTGIVEVARRQRPVLYRFNGKHHLAKMLSALFRAEADTLEPLTEEVRQVSRSLNPRPVAVWLEEGGTSRRPVDQVVILYRDEVEDPEVSLVEAAVRRHAEGWGVQIPVVALTLDTFRGRGSTNHGQDRDLAPKAVPIFGKKPSEIVLDLDGEVRAAG